jgi:hypothetical protein
MSKRCNFYEFRDRLSRVNTFRNVGHASFLGYIVCEMLFK